MDKASRSTEQYLRKRLDELKTVYNDIHEMRVAKEEENKYDHPFIFFIPVSSTSPPILNSLDILLFCEAHA